MANQKTNGNPLTNYQERGIAKRFPEDVAKANKLMDNSREQTNQVLALDSGIDYFSPKAQTAVKAAYQAELALCEQISTMKAYQHVIDYEINRCRKNHKELEKRYGQFNRKHIAEKIEQTIGRQNEELSRVYDQGERMKVLIENARKVVAASLQARVQLLHNHLKEFGNQQKPPKNIVAHPGSGIPLGGNKHQVQDRDILRMIKEGPLANKITAEQAKDE